jgi:hypothetical protein
MIAFFHPAGLPLIFDCLTLFPVRFQTAFLITLLEFVALGTSSTSVRCSNKYLVDGPLRRLCLVRCDGQAIGVCDNAVLDRDIDFGEDIATSHSPVYCPSAIKEISGLKNEMAATFR